MKIIKIKYLFLILVVLTQSTSYAKPNNKEEDVELLLPISIFKPLLADPKWPRFSVAYQYYTKGLFKGQVFAPTFGDVIPLVRWRENNKAQYEISVHAGLFASMDIQHSPSRLINSDYFIGPALAIKNDKWDLLTRVAHTSSHLGDELLLSPQGQNITRVNLSYEVAEEIVAYNFSNGFRPYVGAGYIFHADPKSYRTPVVMAGLDYRNPEYYLYGYAKPVFGVYSQTSNNFNWRPSFSFKGGLEFKDKFVIGRQLQLLLEYYNGNSFQGQFYKTRENYFGISLSLNS
jgi:hypothetical protein